MDSLSDYVSFAGIVMLIAGVIVGRLLPRGETNSHAYDRGFKEGHNRGFFEGGNSAYKQGYREGFAAASPKRGARGRFASSKPVKVSPPVRDANLERAIEQSFSTGQTVIWNDSEPPLR